MMLCAVSVLIFLSVREPAGMREVDADATVEAEAEPVPRSS
jgi:hypothetical protein